jgi:hypothetical protein
MNKFLFILIISLFSMKITLNTDLDVKTEAEQVVEVTSYKIAVCALFARKDLKGIESRGNLIDFLKDLELKNSDFANEDYFVLVIANNCVQNTNNNAVQRKGGSSDLEAYGGMD